MSFAPQISRWERANVDRTKEHFELRFGSANDENWSDWPLVALVGSPVDGVVPVQFLVAPEDSLKAAMIADTSKEIQFYLIDLEKNDPWGYAQYHCETTSNMYSDVHWSFFREES
jgi:hypothetical protein